MDSLSSLHWAFLGRSRKKSNLAFINLYLSRNGMFLQYEGDVQAATEKQLKDWLTCENTLKIIGIIDEV